MLVTLGESNVVDTIVTRKMETVHARAIRNANSFVAKTAPPGARGFIWTMRVYAVTGATPTLTPATYNGFSAGKCPVSASLVAINGATTNAGILWFTGAAIGDGTKGTNSKIVSLPTGPYVEFNMTISGTFTAGEGFDFESEVTWIF